MKSPTMAYCIEVSARGIAFTRCLARPYIAEKIKRAWWLHDEKPGGSQQRNDEWFAPVGADQKLLHAWARDRAAKGFIICAIAKDDREQAEAPAKYKKLGYRLWRTEALMVCSTSIASSRAINRGIIHVNTKQMAYRLGGLSKWPHWGNSRSEFSALRFHVPKFKRIGR
jgi:hypothetical protein